MQDQINSLRQLTRNYKAYDDELRGLNSRVYELREARKTVEVQMIDILKQEAFKEFNKLKIEDDGSTIRIQRPQTWTKAWNISQKDLKSLIDSYFQSTPNPNPQDCYAYIISTKKATLLSDEFAITRTTPNEAE
jgi:hypothetical protein